jgi:hypothetical protein
MPRTVATENPGVEVRRYLRHWANVEHLAAEVQSRHPGTTAEKRRRKARDISASIAQAIELLEAASTASLLTKPLPLFYAAEALGKAVCILADPSLEGGDFKSHGLRGVKSRRYVVRTLTCAVNPPGSDVWSRLLAHCNNDWVQISLAVDGVGQVIDKLDEHPNQQPRQGSQLILGELARHLPELAEDLPAAKWGHPYVVHVSSSTIQTRLGGQNGPPASATVQITLRHAHNQTTREMILGQETPRGHLRGYVRGQDVLDVVNYYFAHAQTLDDVPFPPLRLDIFGELYMDFCREKVVLGELPIYYASLFILSDAVRYQGQWRRLLDDHPEEAVLIDRFLDIAIRKLPNLALNALARGVHLFKVGR